MPTYASNQEAMNATVAALRQSLIQAQTNVGGGLVIFDWFGSSTSKTQALGNLKQYSATIDKLDRELREKVLKGTMTYAAWDATAKTVHDSIRFTDTSVGEFTARAVAGGAIAATTADVKQLAEQVGTGSLPFLALIAVALVALVILRFSI
jgi:hypothetical protein